MHTQNIESIVPTDRNGTEIKVRSIIQITGEDLLHDGRQGLVVSTDSEVEYDGKLCNIVVFFYPEVEDYHFSTGSLDLADWDNKYKTQCRASDTDFIFENDLWKECPRIQYFSSEEMLVQKNWSIKTLIDRVFNGSMEPHFTAIFKNIGPDPEEYMCFCKECNNVASRIAILNVWGVAYPLRVCGECFPKINGKCVDGLPELKKPFLLADGKTPIPS